MSGTIAQYRAYSVRGVQDALDPNKGYAHVASTCTLIKNATTVALAIISDFIMVWPMLHDKFLWNDSQAVS